ncbi:pentapeptide repeat-containing protein [Paenibacillus sp. GCM10027626]|uniref:pentapeptide repeat-containing protein n=1 Tax=Paenibacillus sp. GCM10027626 TaxID=3273411 RepID=UPI00363706A2
MQQGQLRSVRFYDCTFVNCNFSETRFVDCKFSSCTFESCNMNMIEVLDCEFSDASFTDCKLLSVNWTEAVWPKIRRERQLRFERCVLNHSTFIGLSLPKIVMVDCLAKNVDFREADLSESELRLTDFAESLFSDTNLMAADFSNAANYAIDPAYNKINKAKFTMPAAISLLYAMDIEIVEE